MTRQFAVLLPGLDGTVEPRAMIAEKLSATMDVEVIAYPRDISHGYTALIDIVLDRLPRPRPYVLIGESFSGPVAISIAAQRPPGLSHLVLAATFARFPSGVLSLLAPLASVTSHRNALARMALRVALGRAPEDVGELLIRSVESVDPIVIRSRVEAAIRVDVTPALSSIEVPTLYLRATRDHLVARTAGTSIANEMPSLHFAEIDSSHFLFQAAPSQCAAAIVSFCESHHASRN